MLVGCGWWSQCVDSTDASKRVVALSSTLDRSISVEEGTRTPFGPSRPISTRPRFRFGREGANEEESPEFGSTASRAKVVVPPPPSPTTAGSRLCPPRPTAPFGHLSPSIHGLVNTGNSCRGSLHTIDRNEQPTAPSIIHHHHPLQSRPRRHLKALPPFPPLPLRRRCAVCPAPPQAFCAQARQTERPLDSMAPFFCIWVRCARARGGTPGRSHPSPHPSLTPPFPARTRTGTLLLLGGRYRCVCVSVRVECACDQGAPQGREIDRASSSSSGGGFISVKDGGPAAARGGGAAPRARGHGDARPGECLPCCLMIARRRDDGGGETLLACGHSPTPSLLLTPTTMTTPTCTHSTSSSSSSSLRRRTGPAPRGTTRR